VNTLLQKCRDPTKKMISNLVAIELAYINTNHPDFIGGGGAINSIFERMAQVQAMQQQQSNEDSSAISWQQNQQVATGQTQQISKQSPSQQQPSQQPSQQPYQQPYPQQYQQYQQPQQQRQAQTQQIPYDTDNQQNSNGFFNRFFGQPPPNTNPTSKKNLNTPKPNASLSNLNPLGKKPSLPSSQTMTSTPQTTTIKTNRVEKLEQVPQTIKTMAIPTDKEQFETELIVSLLDSYFDVVRKNVKDTVPKTIMHFLVNASKDNIQNELVSSLYKEELMDDLLSESPGIAARRKQCKEMLQVLH